MAETLTKKSNQCNGLHKKKRKNSQNEDDKITLASNLHIEFDRSQKQKLTILFCINTFISLYLRMFQRINSIHILLVIILVKVVHCQSLSPIGPSTCDSDPSIEGYSDIDVLRQDIIINSNITNKSQGGTYTLCPSIIFSFSNDFNTDTGNKDPLVIDANHTRIQCGSDALSTKGCVFQGGERHMLIIENPYNVTVQGVTMIESNEVSVIISSSVKSSSVIFTDCTWQVSRKYCISKMQCSSNFLSQF